MSPFRVPMACLFAAAVVSCGGSAHRATSPVDEKAAAEQAKRYEEMIARAEKKASEGRPDEKIQAAIAAFQQEVGRMPTNLTEIVSSGVLQELPRPPPGRTYLYAPEKGRVVLVPAPDRPQPTPAAGGGQPYIP